MTEASGPAVTGAGGSVGVGKGFRPVSGIAEAGGPTGTGAGGPVVAGTRFLAVAEVYAPFEETEGDPQSDISKFDQISETITEVTSSPPRWSWCYRRNRGQYESRKEKYFRKWRPLHRPGRDPGDIGH